MEYEETVVRESLPRIVVRRPILTPEESEQKRKEINDELSKIVWRYAREQAQKAKAASV